MMLRLWYFLILLAAPVVLAAQEHIMPPPPKPKKIALLAPLYLDSLFVGDEMRYTKSLPPYVRSGLDFVQGAQIAFDTLHPAQKVEVTVFDTKSASRPVSILLQSGVLKQFDLIIGSIRPPEFTLLSDFARANQIPVVSATYPNDAGVTDNPYLIIVNSTLRAHIEGIYSYLLQKHFGSNVYLIKEKGDDRIDNYFKSLNRAGQLPMVQIRKIESDTSITTQFLRARLDTSKPVLLIGATLQQDFAFAVAKALYPIAQKNPVSYLGMPNWGDFPVFRKNELDHFPIRYTAAVYTDAQNPFLRFLDNRYFELYRTLPSNDAQTGFETTLFFTRLLVKYGSEFLNHLGDPDMNRGFDFHFAPVRKISDDNVVDYIENKHVYFLRSTNGKVTRD